MHPGLARECATNERGSPNEREDERERDVNIRRKNDSPEVPGVSAAKREVGGGKDTEGGGTRGTDGGRGATGMHAGGRVAAHVQNSSSFATAIPSSSSGAQRSACEELAK